MRVLFVENRQKTRLWAAIAGALSERGAETAFVVQNHLFVPKSFKCFTIPYPGRGELHESTTVPLENVATSDRAPRHFGMSMHHYGYYANRVLDIIDAYRPDALVGETTLFHELLAVEVCRIRDVPYLHPTGTRYPNGRFMVLAYDTTRPVGGSGIAPPDAVLSVQAEQIRDGTLGPAYMRRRTLSEVVGLNGRRVREWAKVLLAYAMGERYNTPSPLSKACLELRRRRRLAAWRRLSAQRSDEKGRPAILYPMQMEPEANIDVWGRLFRDQTELLRKILAETGPETVIRIKLNPKAKYEVSDELMALIEASPRLRPLPPELGMADAVRDVQMIVTVTGTIGFEAVFQGLPCISLGHPVLAEHFPAFAARSTTDLQARLLDPRRQPSGSAADGKRLLEFFYRSSYPGMISDHIHDPEVLSSANVTLLADGIRQALAQATAGTRMGDCVGTVGGP